MSSVEQPVFIGIPILNRLDLLVSCIEAIDYPAEIVVVGNSIDRGFQQSLNQYAYEKGFSVLQQQRNLGVSASWNLLAKTARDRGRGWFFIGSNDTTLHAGSLKAALEFPKEDDVAVWHLHAFNFFLLRWETIERVGYFDENFYPAYKEDQDYAYRCQLAGLRRVDVPNAGADHFGSATIRSNEKYAIHNRTTHFNWNLNHYRMKWGDDAGAERFQHPYDNPEHDWRWWPDPGGSIEVRDWDADLQTSEQIAVPAENATNRPIETLFQELARLSGPLREPSGRLYGSFHCDEYVNTDAERNTLDRFEQLEVPLDLSGKTVLDVGSNTGACSFEFARRGAEVLGLECHPERVNVCNMLSHTWGSRARFLCLDVDGPLPPYLDDSFDIVCCTSLEAYVDRQRLAKRLAGWTRDLCYFESNAPEASSHDLSREVAQVRELYAPYFRTVVFVGQSAPQGRRVFVFRKEHPLEFRRDAGFIQDGWIHKRFYCVDEWDAVRHAMADLQDLPWLPEIDCSQSLLMKSRIIPDAVPLSLARLDPDARINVKQQMLAFLRELNRRGYAHRDLSPDNVLVANGRLYVVDWEFATRNECPFADMYDLTGKGCVLPGASPQIGAQTVFGLVDGIRSESIGQVPVSTILGIEPSDLDSGM